MSKELYRAKFFTVDCVGEIITFNTDNVLYIDKIQMYDKFDKQYMITIHLYIRLDDNNIKEIDITETCYQKLIQNLGQEYKEPKDGFFTKLYYSVKYGFKYHWKWAEMIRNFMSRIF